MKLKKDKLEFLKEKHDKALLDAKEAELKMINIICRDYNDKEYREILIKQAEMTGFSQKKLDHIKKAFSNFNEDNINYNTVVDIMDAQKYINESNKESFFSKIANIIPEDKNGSS